jgi:AcrR family transcriptional regulator
MARPRRVSDEEILVAVRRAVTDEGPHVSLDVGAERLGVTSPALFRRFRSRNDLMIAALRPEEKPPFIDFLDAGPDDRPIEAQLVEVLTRIGSFLAETLPCVSALRESGIRFEEIHESWQEPPPLRTARALAGWIERAQARGLVEVEDAQLAATTVLGALQAPIFFRHLARESGPWDAEAFARALTQLLLEGLSPRATPTRARASQRRAPAKERS